MHGLKYRVERGISETRVPAEDPTRIESHHLERDDFLHVSGDAGFRTKEREL